MENPTTTRRDVEQDHLAQRASLRERHATALAKLMAERTDLRGTYAFADLVADSLCWSA